MLCDTPRAWNVGSSELSYWHKYDRTCVPASKSSGVSQFGAEAGSLVAQNSVQGRRHPGSMR
ncbi:hypothetical protein [Microcoleus sp. B3-A4]|uniref:hypothetical protein n=1 Tax=Microcoleus sp. B3-A4 TaxID=2818653 RepID=UPI002FD384D1